MDLKEELEETKIARIHNAPQLNSASLKHSQHSDMRILAFVDLDDTLFARPDTRAVLDQFIEATETTSGSAGSYASVLQLRLLEWLRTSGTIIPTTGRSLAAFARVGLGITGPAILNHGATIVDAKIQAESHWLETMHSELLPRQEELECLFEETKALAEANVRVRLIQDHKMNLYIAAKVNAYSDRSTKQDSAPSTIGTNDFSALHRLAAQMRARVSADYRVQFAVNALSIMPRTISKARAVAHLLERERAQGPVLALGVGDARSDAEFLTLCDFAMMPQGCELLGLLNTLLWQQQNFEQHSSEVADGA